MDDCSATWTDWSPLHTAAYGNNVGLLLEHSSRLKVNTTDRTGHTPLQVAVENFCLEVITTLIELGASFDFIEINGLRGIKVFEHAHYFDLGIQLLPLIGPMSRRFLVSVACHAAFTNQPRLLELVIQNKGFDEGACNEYDSLGCSPIHYAAIGGSLECTTILLSNGGSAMTSSRPDLYLPSHYACSKGHVEIFNALLLSVPMASKILNSQDGYGHTPFHLAVYNGCWDFLASFQQLLPSCDENHEIIDSNGHTLQGLLFAMRPFIPPETQIDIPCLSSDETHWLLHSAISDKDVTLASFALSQNANPNCFDLMQQTPLIHAAKLGLSEMCLLLLENGAEQTIRDWSGRTALHYAARNGHLDLTRLLSQFPRADWLSLSMDQYTALDLALYGGHLAIAEECLLTMTSYQHSSSMASTSWMKTLNLAVPVATRHVLQTMSALLFPSDWFETLVANDSNRCGKLLVGTHRELSHPKLRSYSPYPSFRIYPSDMKKKSKLRKKRRDLAERICNERFTNFVQIYPPSVKGAKVRSSFRNQCRETYYPIHQSLHAKNRDVFLYLLEQAQLAGLLDQFLACKGTSGMSVAELLVQVFPEIVSEQSIEEAVYQCLLQAYPFGDGISFSQALLYYIVSACYSTKKVCSPSLPLNEWPMWLLLKHLKVFAATLGVYGDIDLQDLHQVCQLIKNIIQVEGIDVTESPSCSPPSIWYGSLLFTAVINGVPPEVLEALLVETKIIDLSKPIKPPRLKPRWALTEALIKGYQDLAWILLAQGDLASVLSATTDDGQTGGKLPVSKFQEELLYSMQFLYSEETFQFTKELLGSFPHDFFRYFLLSRHGIRLLYICLTSDEASDLGSHLLDGYVAILSLCICDDAVNNKQPTFTSLSNLKQILCVIALTRGRSSWSVDAKSLDVVFDLVRFSVHAKEIHPSYPIIHQLCGRGQVNILKVILDRCSNREEAFSSDIVGFTPLYSAAVGGHLDIVKVLLATFPSLANHDSKLTPLLGTLVYLAYANVARHRIYQAAPYSIDFLIRLVPPFNSPSDLYELRDSSLLQELVETLAPSQYQHHMDVEFADLYVRILFSIPDLSPLMNLLDGHFFSQALEACHHEKLKCVVLKWNSVSDHIVSHSFGYDESLCPKMLSSLLEKLTCKFPPFNPIQIVRKGYHEVLWNSVLCLHGTACQQIEGWILRNWQDAVLDVIRRGFGELALHLLKNLIQISEFKRVMKLKTLLAQAVGGGGGECCIEVLKYLLDLGPTTQVFVSTVVCAVRRGSLESLKVLIAHNKEAVMSQFPSILSSTAKSGQSGVVSYFYENQCSEHLESDKEFWLIVFKNATHSGHEQLALHALSKMPFNVMMALSSSVEVLYHVCWWGMVEVLSSLCVDRDDVFFQTFNFSTPIEASLCNGHIGKLSETDGFPLLLDVMQSTDRMQAIQLDLIDGFSFGWQREMSMSNISSTETKVLNSSSIVSLSILPLCIINKLPNIYHFLDALVSSFNGSEVVVYSYIRTWGNQTAGVFYYLYKSHSVNVLYLAVVGGSSDIVQSISRILFDAGIINKFITLKLCQKALLKDKVGTLQLLRMFCDVNSLAKMTDVKSGNNILHFVAEYSQSYECAELMISMMKGHVVKLANCMNYSDMTPLRCAIGLGKYYVVQQLISLSIEISGPEKKLLMRARGWFRIMMNRNAARSTVSEHDGIISNLDQNVCGCFPSIRKKSVLGYYKLFKNYHTVIAQSMMEASCGHLPLNGLEHANKHTEYGYQDPSFHETTWTREKLLEFVNSKEITRWCLRGQFEPAITVMRHMVSTDEADLLKSVCIEKMFWNACARGSLRFVEYIFDVRPLLHSDALTNSAVIEGFVTAIGLGHLEIAAYIVLNGGVSQQQLKLELLKNVKLPPIVKLIFFGSADEICNALCNVLKQGRSSRAVTSQVWLMHNWGNYQKEMLKSRLQSVSRMVHSQKIKLSTVHDSLLSVDFASFPVLELGACPLSRPVLILSSCVTHLVPMWRCPPLFPLDGINEDSIITLSCALYSSSPRLDNSGYYCNVILSFDTQTSLFQWPTSNTFDEPSQTSDTSSSSLSPVYTIPCQHLIQMSAKSCLLNCSDIPVPVRVHCKPLVGFDGCPPSLLLSVVQCANDVLAALRLMGCGYSLYTELGLVDAEFLMHYQHRELPSKHTLKDLFTKVLLELDFGISSVQSYSQERIFKICIGMEAESYDGYTCRFPSSGEIVSQVCSSIVTSEMVHLSNALSTYLSSLPLSLSVYRSMLNGDDRIVDLTQPADLSLEDVIILKFLPLIKKFIKLFVGSLNSFDNLLYKVSGIKLVFTLKDSGWHFDPNSYSLSIYILDILPHRRNRIVSIVIHELLREANLLSNCSSTAVAVASCLDISENIDFFTTLNGGHAAICNAEGIFIRKLPLKFKQNPDNRELYEASATVNSLHVHNSPVSFVCKRNVYQWQAENSAFVTEVGKPIQLIVSHPGGGCWTHQKPRLEMINYVSVRDKMSPLDPSVKKSCLTAEDLVHHVGLVYGRRAITKWTPNKHVLLRIYSDDGKRPPLSVVNVVSMGHGAYQVFLRSTKCFTGGVVAACSLCQCALKTHIQGGQSLLSCVQILSGPLSPHQCKVQNKGHLKVTAGSRVSTTILLRDKHYNKYAFGPTDGLPDIRLRLGMTEVSCRTKLTSPSHLALVSPRLETSGRYALSITYCGIWSVVDHVVVKSADPYPPNCTAVGVPRDGGIFEVDLSMLVVTVSVRLFDMYGNPCNAKSCYKLVNMAITGGDGGVNHFTIRPSQERENEVVGTLTLSTNRSLKYLDIRIMSQSILDKLAVLKYAFKDPFNSRYRRFLFECCIRLCRGYTPTLTIDRRRILESAIEKLYNSYFYKTIRVRFGTEQGIDVGGLSREFFHLLSMEFVNPHYALFCCTPSGLYKPYPNSSVNQNHLYYFEFFGKILAKTIAEGHNLNIRFTASVYKILTGDEMTLENIKEEDTALYEGLQHVLQCEAQSELDEIVSNFTTNLESFGNVQTVELVRGGGRQTVTMENKAEYVNMFVQYHLLGCIEKQLQAIKKGFSALIPTDQLCFTHTEMESILTGQKNISLDVLKSKTVYRGYSDDDRTVVKLWRVLSHFTQNELAQLLQFSTGSSCIPISDSWQWVVQKTYLDHTHLPQAFTCANTLALPMYTSEKEMRMKLISALSMGAGFHTY